MKTWQCRSAFAAVGLLVCLSISPVWGATFDVSNLSQFQAALTTASTNGQDDVVNVAASVYNVTATLQYASDENHSLTINGAGSHATIPDGGKTVRIFSIVTSQASAHITLHGLRFQNGATPESGGGLQVSVISASITLSDCRINDCTATGGSSVGGGANLTADTCTITVTASTFSGNTCSANVGGLFVGTNSGVINVTHCTFDQNSVADSGGSSYFGDGGGAMVYSDGTSQISVRENTVSMTFGYRKIC